MDFAAFPSLASWVVLGLDVEPWRTYVSRHNLRLRGGRDDE